MKPYLSVIIPYHNAPANLVRLLTSIGKSRKTAACEVLVVDDGSPSATRAETIREVRLLQKNGTRFPLRIVRLPHNRGPAVARNRGASEAKGQFIVFLDNDVEVFPDTLFNIVKLFTDDPDVVALTGVWVKEQRSKTFFPNFKALRDWSYWINERDKSGYYFLFSTRIAAIKRAVFMRLGGFNEEYPAPLVEDIELTYRIARRYAIIFAPNVRVRHEFEEFWPIAKKYFLRAYYWTKLYARRKKFDPVATTLMEAITTISGVGVVVTLAIAAVALVATQGTLTPIAIGMLACFGAVFLLHGMLVGKFLRFVYREKGMRFMLKSFVTGIILYCFIFGGAVAGRITHGKT
jgi:glycosyltransferase involved in cell wall biosynthesis